MRAAIKRWTLRSLVALAGFALLLLITLYLLLDTRRGTQWLLTQALPQAHFESLTGTLSSGLDITGFELSLAAADIRIGKLEGQWSLLDLLGGQLTIQRIAIRDASVVVHPTEEPSEPGPWPSLALPFPVTLAQGDISNLNITLGEDTHQIARISLQISGGPLHTRIESFTVTRAVEETGDQTLSLSGQVGNSLPYPFELSIDWAVVPPDSDSLAGQGLAGHGLAGNGKLSGNLAAIRLDHNLLQPYRVSTQGEIALTFDPQQATIDPDNIQLAIDNQWSKLKLPLEQAVESDGTLNISGGWDSYQFALQSRLTGLTDDPAKTPEAQATTDTDSALEDILATTLAEPGQILASGTGHHLQVELTRLLIETAAGNVQASGQVDGGQPLKWDMYLVVSELQAGLFAPAWPAVISATVQTRGHWQADAWEAGLAIESLSGEIFAETITGTGDITLSNQSQVVDNLLLSLGDNQLNIHGAITDTLALDWQLQAPMLAQIYPDIAGAAASTGSLRGTFVAPLITAQLNGNGLRYGDYRIGTLDFSLDTDTQGDTALSLNAQGLEATPMENGKFTLKGRGNLQQHQLSANLTGIDSSASLALVGGIAEGKTAGEKSWQGKVTALKLDNPQTGPWQLAGATDLRVAPSVVDLKHLCLTQEQSQVCSTLQFEEGNIALDGTIDELQLTRLATALPEGAAIQGAINSRFDLRGPVKNLQGNLSLSVDPLHLSYQAPGEEEALAHSATLSASAALDNTGLNASLDFNIDDVGTVTARIDSPGTAGANPLQRPISGSVKGRFDDLLWLDGLFPQLDNLSGMVGLNLAISGTPAAPVVTGNVQLQQLAMDVPVAGIELRQGHLTLAVENAGSWRLDGGLNSGAGTLTLAGAGLLNASSGASGELTIAGERFTLMNLPETMLLVSPDLRISLDPETVRIRGDIDIPDGRFVLKTLPEQAVQVSADERIYPSEDEPVVPGRSLNTRVQISLNERFRFEGFGLATRLGGSLRLSQRGSTPPQATGTLSLHDGVYEAYGQELTVQNGLLIFQGPLDNPGLNITAVRKTPEATVGIEIGGVAQDIRSEIFSNPALPPTDAMAILITGKAPADMTESDANQVVNAAAALGISQSEWITSRLQSTFGLDVLNLQGGDEYLDSSLVVGKYLTPELFISYVQNLFTPAGSVQLEYSLTRYLGLKASSGETQSVDLLYKIEH